MNNLEVNDFQTAALEMLTGLSATNLTLSNRSLESEMGTQMKMQVIVAKADHYEVDRVTIRSIKDGLVTWSIT